MVSGERNPMAAVGPAQWKHQGSTKKQSIRKPVLEAPAGCTRDAARASPTLHSEWPPSGRDQPLLGLARDSSTDPTDWHSAND